MKKLLATLLVAAMLISCMSVIAFADGSTIYTSTVFPGTDYYAIVEDSISDFAAAYGGFVEDAKSLTSKKLKDNYSNGGTDPLYTWYREEDSEGNQISAIDVTSASYVAVPIYVTNVSSVGIYAEYDTSVLTPVGTAGIYLKTTSEVQSGRYFATGAAGADGDQTGLFDVIFFTVNSGLTGDASGNATTTVKLSFTASEGGNPGKANPASGPAGTIGNDTITINLTGLTPGASEPTDVTVEDLAEPVAFDGTTGGEITGLEIVTGDGEYIDYARPYTVLFGTYDFGTSKIAPEEVGIAVTDSKGTKYYAAKTDTEKFGILFQFMKDDTRTFKSYAKVNGSYIVK